MSDKNHKYRHLIKKIVIDNDEKSYNEFYNLYYYVLVRYSNRIINAVDVAEDIVTEFLIRFFKNKETAINILNVESYLFQSIKNESIKYIQRNKFSDFDDRYFSLESLDLNPHQQLVFDELQQLLKNAIDQLPPKMKEVFLLIREEGLSYKEISAQLGISVKTIENHMTRAIAQLRVIIENYYQNKPQDKKIRKQSFLSLALILLVVG